MGAQQARANRVAQIVLHREHEHVRRLACPAFLLRPLRIGTILPGALVFLGMITGRPVRGPTLIWPPTAARDARGQIERHQRLTNSRIASQQRQPTARNSAWPKPVQRQRFDVAQAFNHQRVDMDSLGPWAQLPGNLSLAEVRPIAKLPTKKQFRFPLTLRRVAAMRLIRIGRVVISRFRRLICIRWFERRFFTRRIVHRHEFFHFVDLRFVHAIAPEFSRRRGGWKNNLLKNGEWLGTTVENRGELRCCEVPAPRFQQADKPPRHE